MEMDKLNAIVSRNKARINALVMKADTYTKEMNEDYEYFFHWHSEDMYKIQLRLTYYRGLQAVANMGNLDDLKTYLTNTTNRLTSDLLNGSLRSRSTSASTNIAFTLELEVKQEVREKYQTMLNDIN